MACSGLVVTNVELVVVHGFPSLSSTDKETSAGGEARFSVRS